MGLQHRPKPALATLRFHYRETQVPERIGIICAICDTINDMAKLALFRPYKLVAFIATRDTTRAKAFYADTLGLALIGEDQFAVVFDANGTMLRITAG
jgi:hypothetical protein